MLGSTASHAEMGSLMAWLIRDYANTDGIKYVDFHFAVVATSSYIGMGNGAWENRTKVNAIRVKADGGNLTDGTIYVYGVNN